MFLINSPRHSRSIRADKFISVDDGNTLLFYLKGAKVAMVRTSPDMTVERIETSSDTPNDDTMARAFNLWLYRYSQSPEKFQRDFQSIQQADAEVRKGEIPSYGYDCAAYLTKLMKEVDEPIIWN